MSRAAPNVSWRPGEPVSADKLNRMINESIREINTGPGLSMIRSPGGRVAISLNERTNPIPDAGILLVIWAIIAAGKYTMRPVVLATADVPSTGAATSSDIGTTGTGDSIGIDLNELGRSVAYNNPNLTVRANFLRTNTTGTKVYTFAVAPADGVLFEVALSNTGGSNGSSSSAASYTYTATAPNGQTLGTGLSPARPRKIGLKSVATLGTGYFIGGGFVLQDAYEKSTTDPCT